MITLPKIKIPTTHVYHDEHGYIGEVNEYEFTELRILIMQEKAEGYYTVTDSGNRANIDSDGRINNWPVDLFPLYSNQLSQLLLF